MKQLSVAEQTEQCINRWKGKMDKQANKGILAYSLADDEDEEQIRKCDQAAMFVVAMFVGFAIGSLVTIWCLS